MRIRSLEIILIAALISCAVGCTSPQNPPKKIDSSLLPVKLSCELPGFDTLAELQKWYKADARTKQLSLFERGELRAVVVVADWGNGDSWDALYFYAPNGYSKKMGAMRGLGY